MQQFLCSDVLHAILLFDEDPFDSISNLRLVCKDWNHWIMTSHQLLQDCVISTLKKSWAVRKSFENEPFQVNLFNLQTGNEMFGLAVKYYKLVKNHLVHFRTLFETFNDSSQPPMELNRVEYQPCLEMLKIIAPFLFLKEATYYFGRYDLRVNTAKIVIANVKGENKFVNLDIYHEIGEAEIRTVCKLLSFEAHPETNSNQIEERNEELLNIHVYMDTNRSWNRELIVEIMELIGLEMEFQSNSECVKDFIYVVLYELVIKSVEVWNTDKYYFRSE